MAGHRVPAEETGRRRSVCRRGRRKPCPLGEIKRLLEPRGVNFRLSPGDKRVTLDLIEAIIPIEQRDVGVATVRSEPRPAVTEQISAAR